MCVRSATVSVCVCDTVCLQVPRPQSAGVHRRERAGTAHGAVSIDCPDAVVVRPGVRRLRGPVLLTLQGVRPGAVLCHCEWRGSAVHGVGGFFLPIFIVDGRR